MRSIVQDTYDRYYTNPEYAEYFWKKIQSIINIDNFDNILEPAAGSGSFFNLLNPEKRIGIDIDPNCPGVQKVDFNDYWPDAPYSMMAVGNNPFGINSKTAIFYFNKCAKFCDVLAFINPKSFRKISVHKQIDPYFHLIFDEDVPPNSFISYNNKKLTVKCCSQIWIKKDFKRQQIKYKKSSHNMFFLFSNSDDCDIALQRIGSRAGRIITKNFKKLDAQQYYFIKFEHKVSKNIFLSLNFNKIRENTGAGRSIGRQEIFSEFMNLINQKYNYHFIYDNKEKLIVKKKNNS